MKQFAFFLSLLLVASTGYAQGTTDASQLNTNGNAPASALGSPFGQSFVPTSLLPLIGVGLAVVDNTGVGDIQISLYHTDASGSTLLGNLLAFGTISAAQISSYYTPATTPLWFPVYFDQAYPQTPGEKLAFTVEGGGTLKFYYDTGSPYSSGRLLADGSKDLTFVTLVPEPGTISFFLLGFGLMLVAIRRRVNIEAFAT